MKLNTPDFSETLDARLQLYQPALEHFFGEQKGSIALKYKSNSCAKMPSIVVTVFTVRHASLGVVIRPLHTFWLN